jgi:glycosyltransferase involved in cell wall biosynthesis/O-antigen/teichoic acid export membrane protein
MAAIAARAVSGAMWTYASYASGRMLVFAGLAVVARLLRPEDVGLFGMAAVGINLLEGTYDFGLRRGLIYFGGPGQPPALIQTGFALTLGLGVVLSGALFALAPLAAMFFGDPRVTDLAHALSVYFGIACLGVVPDALLQHRLDFDRRFWPSVAAPAGRYLIAIALAAMGFGAWSLVWGQLIGVTLEVGLLFVLARWRPRLGWSRRAARRLIAFASQVSVLEWLAALALNLDYLLVGHFLGGAVLGLYLLAFKLPDTTIGAAGYVGSRVLLPAFIELGEHDSSIGSGLTQALRLMALVLVPLAAGLYVLAPQIVPLMFGDQWTEAVPVVQLLAVSACLSGLLQSVGAAFLASGQPRKIIVAQAAWVSVLGPALYYAAQISIVAVAAAHVLGMLVFASVKFALVPSALRVPILALGRAVAPSMWSTAVMVLTLVPFLHFAATLSSVSLLAAGLAVGVTTYTAALWVFDRPVSRQLWAVGTRRRLRTTAEAEPTGGRRPLSVTMLVQSFYPRVGGAEINIQALIQPLRAQGVEVSIVTRRFPGMAPTARVAGARVFRLPVPGSQLRASLTFSATAVWLLARRRPLPDVLHAHELRSPTLTAVLAKFVLRRPVVAHVLRGGLLGDVAVLRRAPLGKLRLRLFKHTVDQFIAVSDETRRELLSVGIPEERITLVSFGVDTNRFRPAAPALRASLRKQLDLESRKVVLVVARLVPEKGLDRLLAAWPTVNASVLSALLVIVGDGSERAALARQAERLSNVRFVGQQRDPLPFLQAADCFTLPSYSEGLPISLLEAMATGVPCVATRIGGISDALDGQLGMLVPPGDAGRLAQALIDTLCLKGDALEALRAAIRNRAVERYSVEANAAALDRSYEHLTRGVGSEA